MTNWASGLTMTSHHSRQFKQQLLNYPSKTKHELSIKKFSYNTYPVPIFLCQFCFSLHLLLLEFGIETLLFSSSCRWVILLIVVFGHSAGIQWVINNGNIFSTILKIPLNCSMYCISKEILLNNFPNISEFIRPIILKRVILK